MGQRTVEAGARGRVGDDALGGGRTGTGWRVGRCRNLAAVVRVRGRRGLALPRRTRARAVGTFCCVSIGSVWISGERLSRPIRQCRRRRVRLGAIRVEGRGGRAIRRRDGHRFRAIRIVRHRPRVAVAQIRGG